MEPIRNTFIKWKDKKYWTDFLITFIFLTIMISMFYFSVSGGSPNLILFIIAVIICFVIITLFLARHVFIGLAMMFIGGFFGFFTDFWGTSTDVFQYKPGTTTLVVLLSGELGNGGVPFEIVASYFFASMWLMQIIESIFDQEIEDLNHYYDKNPKLLHSYKQMLPALIIIIIAIIMVIMKPILIQPWGYFSVGVILTCLVPGNKKIIPIIFGAIVGITGLFFELFCSGEIFPETIIWTYSNPDWGSDILYRAIIAYSGVGMSLASVLLLLLKHPFFRKEIAIIKVKGN